MGVMTSALTRNAYTHTGCTSVGTWKQRWQCIYSIYYTVAYESLGGVYTKCLYILYMAIKECICVHVLFFSFCLFCLSVELLQNYQIQPPGEPFWPRFYKPAPALPDFFLYLFLCTRFLPLLVELSRTCWLLTAQDFSLQVLNLPSCMV